MIRQTPLAVTRRDLLGRVGLGVLGGTVAGGLGPLALPALVDEAKPGHRVVDAPAGHAETAAQSVPFYGPHQAGILTPRPASGIFASFDIVVSSLDELEQMLKFLTERAAFLTQGGEVPARDPKLPPTDSGLLGPVIAPDNLTITLGLGASLFERYDWLTGLKPTRLQRMTQFPNDALDPALCHGDL